MGRKRIELAGLRFGRLTVREPTADKPTHGHRLRWHCDCDCGGQALCTAGNLRNGKSTSCGCERIRIGIEKNQTHGLSGSREYITWCHMRDRCENKNSPAYKRYGGRGITVDPEWIDFLTFYADMGQRPSNAHSLDRIDVNGPYSKANCRWATAETQCNNRRDSVHYIWNEKRQTLAQWSKELHMAVGTLRSRLDAGWPVHRAFTEAVTRR